MARTAKWLLVLAATLAAFVLCLWVGWVVGIKLWPHTLSSTADRWVVSAAFATVMGGGVLAWGGWWAGREKKPTGDGKLAGDGKPTGTDKPTSPSLSIQDIYASEGGSAFGVMHGTQHIYSQPPAAAPETSLPAADSQKHQDSGGRNPGT
jgi:hypothetical protein